MEAAVLFIVFAILLFMGAPIAVCLGVSSIAAMLVMLAGRPVDIIIGTVPQLVSAATSKAVLQAIPFFILGGNIMDASGISRKLIHLAEACVGHLRGGVAMVCVLVACFFAAISGSGPATVAALGIIVIPALVKAGYDVGFAAALMATAGAIGVIIPPSITFVVFGSISDTSIGDLFIAGVLPGLVMGAALIAVTFWLGRKKELTRLPKASGKERWKAFKDAFWGLLIAGCFLDSTSALYIFTPLFFPVAMALNIDPVHFGAIMIVNLAIGLVTPPVGVNLYVACGIADVSLKKISGSVVPLIIASLIVLLIVTYFEPLSLLLLGGSAA